MKKIYFALILLGGSFSVHAQRTVSTEITINDPVTDYYMVEGTSVKPNYTIKNVGPDPIRVGDTIILHDPRHAGNKVKKFWYTVPIPAGTSIQLNDVVLGSKDWWIEYDKDYPIGYPGTVVETLYDCKDDKIESVTDRKKYARPFKDSTKFVWFVEILDIKTPIDSGTVTYASHGIGLSIDTVHIWINAKPLGVLDVFANTKNAIRTYPNPANSKLFFEYNASVGFSKAQIMDGMGRVVLSHELDRYAYGIQKAEIDISALPPGAYFLKLDGADNSIWMDKFLIQR